LILLVDNYDSFVWNLDHALQLAAREIGVSREVVVLRNDRVDPAAVRELAPVHIVLSPGPCGPHEAGGCVDIVRAFAGSIPILGVCLGHQAIAAAFGMRVERSDEPVHGKPWTVLHDGRTVFEGISSPLRAARYHSLVVPEADVLRAIDGDGGWEVSARTDTGVVMGIRRVWRNPDRAAVEGVQFHPESYLTEHGVALLANFLRPHPTSGRPSPMPASSDTIATR
jgi:anthranilate synthase/aminodeoxychorismate synthase-like glutamine amidotransferase